MRNISCTINGELYQRAVSEHKTLLHFLREDLGLTGTKEGCGAGECGACTIILNGKAVNSCLVLASEADNGTIETIEGEAQDGRLTILQDMFDKHHAAQCGFCTPGMMMTTKDLLRRHPHPDTELVKEGIEGNFCRCTGYQQIIEAIIDAADNGAADEIAKRDAESTRSRKVGSAGSPKGESNA